MGLLYLYKVYLKAIQEWGKIRYPVEKEIFEIHSTHIIKFQHNLPQTVHLKAGNNYKDY